MPKVTLSTAAEISDLTKEAVGTWCRRFGIGEKDERGRWLVDVDRLHELIEERQHVRRRFRGSGK
jgi:hypothetical protein